MLGTASGSFRATPTQAAGRATRPAARVPSFPHLAHGAAPERDSYRVERWMPYALHVRRPLDGDGYAWGPGLPDPSVIPVTRTQVRLRPDARRVVIRPFMPGAHIPSNGHARARQVIDRILGLSEAEVASTLRSTMAQFAQRHPDLDGALHAQLRGRGWTDRGRGSTSPPNGGSSSVPTSRTSTPSRPRRSPTRPSLRPRTRPGLASGSSASS